MGIFCAFTKHETTILKAAANIPGDTLVLKNVPANLIHFAVHSWEPNGKYAKDHRTAKNTNSFLRGISVWLILKNETSTGIIQRYRNQLEDLAYLCRMSRSTFEKYLTWLRSQKLISVAHGNLYCTGYDILRKKYSIDINERIPTIYYDRNKQKLPDLITALGVQRKQQVCCDAYRKKITGNRDMHKTLCDLFIQFKADADRVLNDPEYFRLVHMEALCQSFEEERPGQPVYEFLHNDVKANPDLNATAKTYAIQFGLSHAMSFCHIKKRLERQGLITVLRDNAIIGEKRARKDTKIFHQKYLHESKETIWYRPDQIEVSNAILFNTSAAAIASA